MFCGNITFLHVRVCPMFVVTSAVIAYRQHDKMTRKDYSEVSKILMMMDPYIPKLRDHSGMK